MARHGEVTPEEARGSLGSRLTRGARLEARSARRGVVTSRARQELTSLFRTVASGPRESRSRACGGPGTTASFCAVFFVLESASLTWDHGDRLVGPSSGRAGSGCQVGQWLQRGEGSRRVQVEPTSNPGSPAVWAGLWPIGESPLICS